jgi:ABC-type multidrug transport system permease subunit
MMNLVGAFFFFLVN